MVEVRDIDVDIQQAANAFARWRWTSCSPIRYIIAVRKQNIPALTRSLQTLTTTVQRLDRVVRSPPRMAAARGPPPHRPPAHPIARRTAQNLPMIRAPHTAYTLVTILRDQSRPTTGPAVDVFRSVARGTITRHSLAILNAAVAQVGDRVIHARLQDRNGVLGAGDAASSLVTRGFLPSRHRSRHYWNIGSTCRRYG